MTELYVAECFKICFSSVVAVSMVEKKAVKVPYYAKSIFNSGLFLLLLISIICLNNTYAFFTCKLHMLPL